MTDMEKVIRIGMPLEDFRKRTIAIVEGRYKPKTGETENPANP